MEDYDSDQAPPKWVNPCGGVIDAANDGEPLTDAQVARNVILDVTIALDHIQHFKQQMVRPCFTNHSAKKTR